MGPTNNISYISTTAKKSKTHTTKRIFNNLQTEKANNLMLQKEIQKKNIGAKLQITINKRE